MCCGGLGGLYLSLYLPNLTYITIQVTLSLLPSSPLLVIGGTVCGILTTGTIFVIAMLE